MQCIKVLQSIIQVTPITANKSPNIIIDSVTSWLLMRWSTVNVTAATGTVIRTRIVTDIVKESRA